MHQDTMPALAPEPAPASVAGIDARAALVGAVDYLRSLQDPAGWWKGELETNVTMDAEDLPLRQFPGIRDSAATGRAAAWIRSH